MGDGRIIRIEETWDEPTNTVKFAVTVLFDDLPNLFIGKCNVSNLR
jgi:hypothetical protein